MSTVLIGGRKINHIYEEMWSRLRRSIRQSYREQEQGWKRNFEVILALRQKLIDHNCWGTSTRDHQFDTQLQLSLVSQLRLAAPNGHFTTTFIRQLLEEFRHLVIDDKLQSKLANNGMRGKAIEEQLLQHIIRVEVQPRRLPDRVIIDSARNLLQTGV